MCKTLCQFSMHLLIVTQFQHLEKERKRQPGIYLWKVFSDVTKAFEDLMLMEDSINDLSLPLLEHFVVLLYDHIRDLIAVDNARKWLFTQKSRNLETIPPMQEALKQHIKRASYQANCWNMALNKIPELTNLGMVEG